ncbi:hypothetical protein F8388_016315 [Cannabis sativa]|uniref:Uncharacterized protein n=1 Tax=Cannabis sativa TaxID=3483 RepID=A0A7J6GB88_CANSA|nr:hypothetical protein G4B88_001355 [Cannabis sativa]KAF4382305.1 hypothetical protein F8388_016315 [Cannabis sativa]
MPLSTTAIGALLGLGTQMYSNALRKLPYMRRVLIFLSLGTRFGHGNRCRVCKSACEMGRPAPGRPGQDAREGQGRQRTPLLWSKNEDDE